MEELWKDVAGYEGLYQVSNLGRVKSLGRIASNGKGAYVVKSRILLTYLDFGKYQCVKLSRNGKAKQHKVHRLVAEAFISNPNKLPCVNHKDENRQNNNVNNLEWCTHQYNNTYGTTRQRRVKTIRKMLKGKWITQKSVSQYSLSGEFIASYDSCEQAAKATNTRANNISACCHGKVKTANGFIWKSNN